MFYESAGEGGPQYGKVLPLIINFWKSVFFTVSTNLPRLVFPLFTKNINILITLRHEHDRWKWIQKYFEYQWLTLFHFPDVLLATFLMLLKKILRYICMAAKYIEQPWATAPTDAKVKRRNGFPAMIGWFVFFIPRPLIEAVKYMRWRNVGA